MEPNSTLGLHRTAKDSHHVPESMRASNSAKAKKALNKGLVLGTNIQDCQIPVAILVEILDQTEAH